MTKEAILPPHVTIIWHKRVLIFIVHLKRLCQRCMQIQKIYANTRCFVLDTQALIVIRNMLGKVSYFQDFLMELSAGLVQEVIPLLHVTIIWYNCMHLFIVHLNTDGRDVHKYNNLRKYKIVCILYFVFCVLKNAWGSCLVF